MRSLLREARLRATASCRDHARTSHLDSGGNHSWGGNHSRRTSIPGQDLTEPATVNVLSGAKPLGFEGGRERKMTGKDKNENGSHPPTQLDRIGRGDQLPTLARAQKTKLFGPGRRPRLSTFTTPARNNSRVTVPIASNSQGLSGEQDPSCGAGGSKNEGREGCQNQKGSHPSRPLERIGRGTSYLLALRTSEYETARLREAPLSATLRP